ncbi:uncharacterized protein zgc:193726 [Labrus mixtus]|uniref:uncharacterized protein zgc:193726 n=1 Tax=Labrus mixtus TaxID=508554 RepID=UPI0029BFE451|nr:uncharacterized protein zgc:193726 [Labrus mixtus]
MIALTEMMMMVVMMSLVSAGPLPPFSRDENITLSPHLHRYAQENSTRFESHPNVNSSLVEPPRHDSMNEPQFDRATVFTFPRCKLATCLITNLGSDLQRGDEKTGGDTTDPLGFGKK